MQLIPTVLVASVIGLGGGIGVISMNADRALPISPPTTQTAPAPIGAVPYPINRYQPKSVYCSIQISIVSSWFCSPVKKPIITMDQWVNGCWRGSGGAATWALIRDWYLTRKVNIRALKKVKGAVIAGCVIGILWQHVPNA